MISRAEGKELERRFETWGEYAALLGLLVSFLPGPRFLHAVETRFGHKRRKRGPVHKKFRSNHISKGTRNRLVCFQNTV